MTKMTGEGFTNFIVASTTGSTGVLSAQALKDRDVNLVVVGHSVGFKEPGHDEFSPPDTPLKSSTSGAGYCGPPF